jgi:HSP20 family protein
MPALTKEQFNDLRSIENTFSFFRNDFQDYWNGGIPETIPHIHIMEAKENYNVEMIAPGLKKDDFNIEVGRNLITLCCETESFYRSFVIPDDADARGIAATYNDGVLNLSIPKKNETQKNKIHKITVG